MHVDVNLILPTAISGVILGSLYALIALGYTLVYGVLRMINFANTAIFTLGATAVYYALRSYTFGKGGVGEAGWNQIPWLIVMLVLGGGAGALAGLLVERIAYRPLRRQGAPILSYLISAIGVTFFISYSLQQGFLLGPGESPFPSVIDTKNVFTIGSVPVNNVQIWTLVVLAVMFGGVFIVIHHSSIGRQIRAVAEDMLGARLLGVRVDRAIAVTFMIGGICTGISAVLYSMQVGFVSFDLGFNPGIVAFVAAILGGVGNIKGAVLGGFITGELQDLSVPFFGTAWENVVTFTALVLILIVRPRGIFNDPAAVA